jgi:hypothetical protein
MIAIEELQPQTTGMANRKRRGDVVATLTYITPQDRKPVFYSQAYTGGETRLAFEVEQHATKVADMRMHAEGFTVDRHGFSLTTVPTAVADFYDDDEIERVYFREIEELLQRELGAREVEIFDVTRRSDGGGGAANRDGRRGAATRIHVDYTRDSAPKRALDVFGEDRFAQFEVEGARIVQVNVWRPICGPVQRSPLALADASTVAPSDLVATDQVFPDRVGEIYHLTYDPAHRWYYAPEMMPDEVLLIKGWDSLDDGRAQFTPHSAFALPDQDADTPARESIEVRAFVVV